MRFAKNKLLDSKNLRQLVDNNSSDIAAFKGMIRHAHEELKSNQYEGISAAELVDKYTWFIDQIVVAAWRIHCQDAATTLVAVGGYGRAELHPHSDVDLLILLEHGSSNMIDQSLSNYLQFLWDIGLEIGHSVRTIKECLKLARKDITIMTNMLEARLLHGNDDLLETLDKKLRVPRLWSPDKFYQRKLQEQQERHARFQGSAYSLEPSLKENPGGLRDLQTILWIYNRHSNCRSFKQMHQQGHINVDEYRLLIRARNILWKIRCGLHLMHKRREDRLLFDGQRQLATDFGYEDSDTSLAVEQLMKRYYRTAKQIRYLNEILLASYRVNHLKTFSLSLSKPLNARFAVSQNMLYQRSPTLFTRHSWAMVEMFVLLQQQQIYEIHPDTIRALRANLKHVNNSFRSKTKVKQLFMQLFQQPGAGLSLALEKMNAYGLLGAYLPVFGAIVGQMQHDLFHVYTVDGHTLMVIQKLNRISDYAEEFPVASSILQSLHKPDRLFLAALFHDIAKGRGGDHSILGEQDAYRFCRGHALNKYDAKLVAWLVRNHLIMSHFSQRRDISDFDVVQEFAGIVGDQEHLDNLYLLTLADIQGTSPKVWSAWKGQLLLDLYQVTRTALEHGIGKPIDEVGHVQEYKSAALEKLLNESEGEAINVELVEEFWHTLPNEYFIRNEPFYIAWHARCLHRAILLEMPSVSIRYSKRLEANMVFVFAPQTLQLLTKVTGAFDALGINIIDARLQPTKLGFALYSFSAVVPEQDLAEDKEYLQHAQQQLRKLILHLDAPQAISRKNSSRALKHFPIRASVLFSQHSSQHTVMEVVAQNQPGLLHNVAMILEQEGIQLVSARIATFGERAEDIFFIQHLDQTPVSQADRQQRLRNSICNALDNQSAQPAKFA